MCMNTRLEGGKQRYKQIPLHGKGDTTSVGGQEAMCAN